MGLLRKPFLLPLIVCHAVLIGRRTLSDGANQWEGHSWIQQGRACLNTWSGWKLAFHYSTALATASLHLQKLIGHNKYAVSTSKYQGNDASTDFNVKITVSWKYMRTLPHTPCYPASLPSFHPLSVILGTEDRALPVAFKPTVKPQSQCYIYHTDAWWE